MDEHSPKRNTFLIFSHNRYGNVPYVPNYPPSLESISDYNNDLLLFQYMSTKLLSPELELDSQEEEEQNENNDQIRKSMEQEIECPRCSDIMILSSDFDRLLYFCHRCHLSLIMN